LVRVFVFSWPITLEDHRSGIVPIAHSQDTAGPMARTVADAAVILGAIAGADRDDPATQARAGPNRPSGRPRSVPTDYSRFLDAGGLKGARLGVVRNRLFGNNVAADSIAEAAIAAMKQQGATIVDPANIPTLGKSTTASSTSCCSSSRRISTSTLPGWARPRRCAR
jgi:amidase